MRCYRSGVSTAVAAVVLIAAFVVAAAGGYFLGGVGTGGTGSSTTSYSSMSSLTSSSGAASAISSSVSTTSSPTNDTAVMAGLASAAQAECAKQTQTCLTIYTTQDAVNWNEYYGPLFYQQYPWAQGKVQYLSLNAADETVRLLSEYQAHNVIADLATGTLAPLIPVYQGGAFLNYTSPEAQAMGYKPEDVGPAWVVTNLAVVFMVYNPSLLPASQVPRSWSDLANPIYKNKIAFQSATALSISTTELYYLYTSMGNSSGQWTNLMKGIAANHPMLPSTAGDAESDLLNGQASIGIDVLDSYVTALKGSANAPIKIVDIQPMVYTPGVVAITAGASHPTMAKLVEAWFISHQGQIGIYQTNHLPYQTSIGRDLLSYLPPDYKLVDAYSTYANTPLYQNTGAWSDTFRAIFGH